MRAHVVVGAVAHRLSVLAVDDEPQLVHGLLVLRAERVGHIVVGVVAEGCRVGEAAAVVGREAHVGPERQGGVLVDFPLQVHVSRPAVVSRIALADAVRERASACCHEALRRRAVPVVGIVARPCHSSAGLQVLVILVADVEGTRLGGALAVVVAPSAPASSREIAVVHVVGIPHEGVSHGAEGLHGRQSYAVAAVGAYAHVGVHLQAVACAALGNKFQHEVVLAVVDVGHSRQVAFLIVGLHLVDDIRWQVLHHGIVVSRHEVASVHLEFLHTLAVDGDGAVVVDFRTGQCLHQCLDDRAFGHAEGVGVIYQRVVLHHHLRDVGRHLCPFQLHGVGFHQYLAQGEPLSALLGHLARQLLVSQVADAQQVGACRHAADGEMAVVAGGGSRHEGGVASARAVELQRGARQCFAAFLVNHAPRNPVLLSRGL